MRTHLFLYLLVLSLSIDLSSQSSAIDDPMDLRNHDFDTDPIISLDGQWSYADSCLYPSECNPTISVDVPNVRLDEMGFPSFGYGTFYLEFIVDHELPLMLKVFDQFSAYEVYVNGELIGNVGVSGPDKESTTPGRQMLYLPLHDLSSDTVRLAIAISNFSHHKRGVGGKVLLGLEKAVLHQKFLDDSYDMFLTGFLILATFFFLGLFFNGRQDYAILYFALFTLVYAYRIVGWHNYVLHDMINIPYRLGLIFEYSTFYLSGAFFAMYLEKLFPHEAPKVLTRIFAYLSIAWTFSTLLPVQILTQFNIPYLYILLVGIFLMVGILIKAVLNKRPGARYSLYSVMGVLAVFIFKSLNYLHVVEENRLVSIAGELIFFIFQALILSRIFTENWRQAKLEAEQLAVAKSDFLSVMSHEIRTPLNAVIGTAYHLMESDPKPDQVDDLKRLRNSSENLLSLINNVLDYNKIESGKIELDQSFVSLKSYCETQVSLLQPLADQKGIVLKLMCDQDLPEQVCIDRTRVGQVLTNLIGNAIKFTSEGHVILRVALLRESDVDIDMRLEVEDTGNGIAAKDIQKIFGAFEQSNNSLTREYGGVGLGLAISKKLIELMGSTIEIKSEPGIGSKFSFVLTCQKMDEVKLQVQSKEPVDLSSLKVLLVEDNEMNVLIAKRQLEKRGIQVVVASSGAEALAQVGKESFDLILMDLQMPVMDGFEATLKLREMGFDKPIIALTAASVSPKELKEKHLDGMLPKPFSPDDLIAKLKEFVE